MSLGKNKNNKIKIGKSINFPYFVLILSIILTIGASFVYYQSAKTKDIARFSSNVNRIRTSMENRLALYVALLKSGRGFIESTQDLNREKYSNFIQSLEIEKNYAGVQGIGYTKTVKDTEINDFIAKMKAEGLDSYQIFPETNNPVRQPIVYLQPINDRNMRAIGFDMASEENRREAMQKARDTGMASATSRVVLVQENNEDKQYGFLIYLPIYDTDQSNLISVEDRQKHLTGFIYSPFRANNFIKDVQTNAGINDVVITIYDNAVGDEYFMTQSDAGTERNFTEHFGGTFSAVNELEVAGRKWFVRYDSLPSFASQSSINWTPLIFLIGLIFSLLLFGMTFWEFSTRSKLEETAENLAESEQQIQGLLEKEQSARRIAEAANSTKDEFISVVSHELRTPLNAIAGWTRILKSDDLSTSTKELALQKIEKNLRLQTTLVEDLLNYSQLVSNRETLEKDVVDCSEIFENVYAEFEQIAHKKGIDISKENTLSGQKILGDADKIKIVIVNLLSNALKFTPAQGKIVAHIEENADFVEIRIKDSGRGINSEFLPHIFDRFSQFDTSTTRKFGGLGLGLAVSKHIVKLHNGEIEANSEGEGKGSTFSVKIPVYRQ